MVLLGSKAPGRLTEQHDTFFGIAENLQSLVTAMKEFWPEAANSLHIDAWTNIKYVQPFTIHAIARSTPKAIEEKREKLFFINLGGYKKGEFEEYHYKCLIVAADKSGAIQKSKETAFYRHTGFDGASSHVDDKYGVDVDDIYDIEDILPDQMKELYRLQILATDNRDLLLEDELNIGYLKLSKI